MRIRIALVSGLALLLGSAEARADSVSLVWQSTNAPSIFMPGQNEVLNVVLTISSPDIHYVGFSIDWQLPLAPGSQIQFDQTSCAGDNPNGTNWQDICLFQQGNTNGDPGQSSQYAYEAFDGGPIAMTQATATIGTITFDFTNNGLEQISITPGFVNQDAFDGCLTTGFAYCDGGFTLNPATAQLVPEPGTLALMLLGVTALTLGRASARRQR